MSNNLNNLGPAPPPYYLANYQGQVVAIKRDPDYQGTIKLIQKYIASLRPADHQDIVISTSFAVYGDVLARISEEIWPDIVGHVESIETLGISPAGANSETKTFSRTNAQKQIFASAQHSSPSMASRAKHTGPIPVTLRTTCGELIPLGELPDSTTFQDIKNMLETKYAIPVELQQLVLSGRLLDDELKIKQPGILDGEPMDLVLKTRKSAVYLLPGYTGSTPVPIRHAMIQISVNRKWECIASRPSGDPPEDLIHSVSWNVSVTAESTMYDHGSESKIYCFRWDGSPSVSLPASNTTLLNNLSVQLSHTVKAYHHMFELKFNNSVAVPFRNVETYTRRVFGAWRVDRLELLSHFLSEVNSKPCSYLAIRFLPQAEYEKAANISIPGQDARIIHIVILYKPLNLESVPLWNLASPHESEYEGGWEHMNETSNLLRGYHTQPTVVDFTFLEVS